jgi:beta-1,4-mannosyltransferase
MSTPAVFDAIRAVQFLEATGHPEPLLVLYHPLSRNNPFQQLLYAEGWERGVVALPLADLADADAIVDLARGRVRTVLHLHWLKGVTEAAATREDAGALADMFLARLDRLRDRGCRIAWTVHNVMPHDARFADEAIRARRGVAERADLVHVLTASTPGDAEPLFTIPPDRLAVIPHPSYVGVYPDAISRTEARYELGLFPEEFVGLAFGALRPYKRIPAVVAAWQAAGRAADARRLVVAGHAPPGPGTDELVLGLDVAPGVAAFPRRVPVERVAAFFRAADVAVLGHRDSLNSGVLLLALTFGVPVIAPRMAVAVEILDDRVARLYEPGDHDGFVEALRRAPEVATPAAAAAAREIALRHDPAEISRTFVEELRRRLAPVG